MRLTLVLRIRSPGAGRIINFNNKWMRKRLVKVDHRTHRLGDTLAEDGVKMYSPQELFSSHLPEETDEIKNFEFPADPIMKPFPTEESHPNFHERPVYCFDNRSKIFFKDHQFKHAKVLTKTVEVEAGLPQRILNAIPTDDVLPEQDDLIKDVLKESFIFDSTQKLLPRTFRVPYIGWHAVEHTMFHRKMPYDVSHMSWQRRTPREYGIPIARKNQNLLRGMLRHCDRLSARYPSLLGRMHIENCVARQYFERQGKLARTFLPIDFLVTNKQPLEPYADQGAVWDTEAMPLEDLTPMNAFANLWSKQIYRHENNFPVKGLSHMAPYAHTVVQLYNSHIPNWDLDAYRARALSMAFLVALGQARLLYGALPSFSEDSLMHPIAVNTVTSDGKQFHFGAFQLNTLNLNGDDGIKNIFWHNPEPIQLFDTCGYVQARPTLTGYDPTAFRTLLGMYLQGAAK